MNHSFVTISVILVKVCSNLKEKINEIKSSIFVIIVYLNQVRKMFAWRVKTSECMDMPDVLVAGSGVQEVIKRYTFFIVYGQILYLS